ncbi:hypothetical protein Dimus_025186 [Dionaea muscipula]
MIVGRQGWKWSAGIPEIGGNPRFGSRWCESWWAWGGSWFRFLHSGRDIAGICEGRSVGEAQEEGSCSSNWAEECERDLQGLVEETAGGLQYSSPVKVNGDFLKALTQSALGEEAQAKQPQMQPMEGNRIMCNGWRLSGIDRRSEEIIITEEDVLEERLYWQCALIGWGHKGEDCRAPKLQRKEWRPVKEVPVVVPSPTSVGVVAMAEVARGSKGMGDARGATSVSARGVDG